MEFKEITTIKLDNNTTYTNNTIRGTFTIKEPQQDQVTYNWCILNLTEDTAIIKEGINITQITLEDEAEVNPVRYQRIKAFLKNKPTKKEAKKEKKEEETQEKKPAKKTGKKKQ